MLSSLNHPKQLRFLDKPFAGMRGGLTVTHENPRGLLLCKRPRGVLFYLPLGYPLFGLRLPLLALQDEGGGEGRNRQGNDPNQHAGIAGGGGIAAAGLNGHIAHSGTVMAIQGNEGENGPLMPWVCT